jgi:hypothetical protein
MSSITGFSRKNLGPLTTTHSLPSSCAVAVQECSTCTQAWQGQTCFGQSTGVADNADCWPPRTPSVSTPPPPLNGWGFYSPGLACPAGMTSACSATGGQPASWTVQFSLLNQETAVGCCPRYAFCDMVLCQAVNTDLHTVGSAAPIMAWRKHANKQQRKRASQPWHANREPVVGSLSWPSRRRSPRRAIQ